MRPQPCARRTPQAHYYFLSVKYVYINTPAIATKTPSTFFTVSLADAPVDGYLHSDRHKSNGGP